MIYTLVSSPCDCDGREGSHDHIRLLIDALALAVGGEGDEWPPRPNRGITYDYIDEVCFRALVAMIDSNSGMGFLNIDQGHPAYALGRGGKIDPMMGGDSPEENRLFRLLQRFPDKYHEQIQDLRTWEKFCAFAFDAHGRNRRW